MWNVSVQRQVTGHGESALSVVITDTANLYPTEAEANKMRELVIDALLLLEDKWLSQKSKR